MMYADRTRTPSPRRALFALLVAALGLASVDLPLNATMCSSTTTPPTAAYVAYAGGALEVTSNSGSNPVVWAVASMEVAPGCTPLTPTAPDCSGTLFAYDANTLSLLWCSNSQQYCDQANSTVFAKTPFARPMIVNGNVYIPTGGVTQSQATGAACTTVPCSGVLVYIHTP
jgi:hypothetical protein